LSLKVAKKTKGKVAGVPDVLMVVDPDESWVKSIPIETVTSNEKLSVLKEKIVFVGTTLPGVDATVLPNGKEFHGVYGHAILTAVVLKFLEDSKDKKNVGSIEVNTPAK
jgi:hypothetical protein